MTYKSNATMTCDHCGKTVPVDDNLFGAAGWLELHQRQLDPESGWYEPQDLGDFCSLECLHQYILPCMATLTTGTITLLEAKT